MGEICEHWVLEVCQIRVMFMALDSYRTIYPIELEAEFQRICHIYHILNKNVVDIIIEEVSV